MLAAVILALALPVHAEDTAVAIQRLLVNLKLGNWMGTVKTVYPPTRDWPSIMDPGGEVKRYTIERSYARGFPDDVETLRLGFYGRKLVRIQAIFDRDRTRKEPLEELVVTLSTTYGEPRRRGMTFIWRDGDTVLRAFNEELPSPDGSGMEMRVSMEIMDEWVYRP